ncbi:hypothetical protein ACFL6C_06900 [Myxococcota bacterium]
MSGRCLQWTAFGLLLSLFVVPSGLAEAKPRHILFVGNSFTQTWPSAAHDIGGVPALVRQFAVARGHDAPNIQAELAGGTDLAWHLVNSAGAIASPTGFVPDPDFQWDQVVMQEFSTKPTRVGDPDAFRADALAYYELVTSHSSAVEAVLYETWAREWTHDIYTWSSFGDPHGMQEDLRSNYGLAREDIAAVAGDSKAAIARVGDAFEAGSFGDLYAEDLYHPNNRGAYLAGLVMFATLFCETPLGLPKILDELTDEEVGELQTLAAQVTPACVPECEENCGGDDDEDPPGCRKGHVEIPDGSCVDGTWVGGCGALHSSAAGTSWPMLLGMGALCLAMRRLTSRRLRSKPVVRHRKSTRPWFPRGSEHGFASVHARKGTLGRTAAAIR